MTAAVIDASVLVKWFRTPRELHTEPARALRVRFEDGRITIVTPSLLFLELLNIAGRRWRLQQHALVEFAGTLQALRFDVQDASLVSVAEWTARGLTAYDAAYVALAEMEGLPLVTDDAAILRLAPDIARPLSGITS